VAHHLVPATSEDKPWLEQLRRAVYRDLFFARGAAGMKLGICDIALNAGRAAASTASRSMASAWV